MLQRAENAVHSKDGSTLIALLSTHRPENGSGFIHSFHPAIYVDRPKAFASVHGIFLPV